MNTETPSERTAIIRTGAAAARDQVPRSDNPYPPDGENWINWMEGYDHQTVWIETGRGDYEPSPEP